MKALFLYNKNSGKGKIIKYLDYINEKLSSSFDELEIYSPTSTEDFINAIINKDYDYLLFAGGDGTFNIVVNTLLKNNKNPILGYIPTGTCNDIARNNNIPINIKEAIDVISKKHTKYHDVTKIGNDYFLYVACMGMGTSATYIAEQKDKKLFGKLGYLKSLFISFFKKEIIHAKLIYDNNIIEGDYSIIFILNTKEVGTFKFNRDTELNSGKVEVALIDKGRYTGRFRILKYLVGGLLFNKKEKSIPLDNFKIEVSDEHTWNIDGEKGPTGTKEFKVLHNKIELITKE